MAFMVRRVQVLPVPARRERDLRPDVVALLERQAVGLLGPAPVLEHAHVADGAVRQVRRVERPQRRVARHHLQALGERRREARRVARARRAPCLVVARSVLVVYGLLFRGAGGRVWLVKGNLIYHIIFTTVLGGMIDSAHLDPLLFIFPHSWYVGRM